MYPQYCVAKETFASDIVSDSASGQSASWFHVLVASFGGVSRMPSIGLLRRTFLNIFGFAAVLYSISPAACILAKRTPSCSGVGGERRDDDRWQWTTNTADFPFNVDGRAADNWSMHELRYGCFGVLHHRHVGSYQRCQQHSGECELFIVSVVVI